MRLFIAAWPPEEILGLLGALPRPERRGLRWTTPDQWHVTLRFLGELDDPAPVADALATAALPRARAVLGPKVVRIGRDAAAFPVAGVDALAAAITDATATFGRAPRARFRGHLTIARARDGRLDAAKGFTVAGQWDVTAVDLVRSELHPDGARYRTVASFALGARPPD